MSLIGTPLKLNADDGNIAEHARRAFCCPARPEELLILAARARGIQGMAPQSYLFFGSADRLYQHVKELLFEHPGFPIFDFRRVIGIDSS